MKLVIPVTLSDPDNCPCCGAPTCDCAGCPDGYWTEYTGTIPPGTVTNNFGGCNCDVYNGPFTWVYVGNCTWDTTAKLTDANCLLDGGSLGLPLWRLQKFPAPTGTWATSNQNQCNFGALLSTTTNCLDPIVLEAGPEAFGQCRINAGSGPVDITLTPGGTFVRCPMGARVLEDGVTPRLLEDGTPRLLEG